MRCNWRRWLWGIVPLLVLSWVAVQAVHGRMERDLAERAGLALADSGLGWAMAAFQGRDGLLTGLASQEGEPAKAAEILGSVWGVRVVDSKASLIEKAEKYLWWATRRNNRIRLSGYAPSHGVRQAILGVTKVSFPGFEIVDRMTLARGIPSGDIWLGGVSFALKQLASLKRGDVRLEDLTLGVAGEAEDAVGYRAVKLSLGDGLPKGIKLGSDNVTPPVVSPHTWAAQFTGGQLVLTGHVPSESARAELLAAAKASLAGVAVIDQMEPGDGVPPGWIAAATACVRGLPRLQTGSAELKDGVLSVAGMSADAAAAEAVRGSLRAAMPASIKLTDQIKAKEPPAPPPPAPAAPPAKEPEPAISPGKSEVAPQPTGPPPSSTTASKDEAVPLQPMAPRVASLGDPRAKPCEDALAGAAAASWILFRSGNAEIDDASFSTLDRLAQAVKSCPGMRIEVGGHASAEGSGELNQQLSVRRAQTVVAYLVQAGVEAAQLEAVGFGATRPIAPNDTGANMARNRRIEFTVRPN